MKDKLPQVAPAQTSDARRRPRRSKSKKRAPSTLKYTIAENVTMLRDRIFSHLPNPTARNRALAAKAQLSYSQVHRVCNGKLDPTSSTIHWLAQALNERPSDLLVPFFAQGVRPPEPERPKPPGKADPQKPPERTRKPRPHPLDHPA